MKIGIISDVHGDYEALVTALDQLEAHHSVELVLCAGDLVGRGPFPNDVVDLIRARDIPTVRGNHDEFCTDITPGHRHYLRSLPLDLHIEVMGVSIYMTHGKPGNNIWGMYPSHVSDTLLGMMLRSLCADVLVAGHTHVPMCIRVARGMAVNPGSLYTVNSMRGSSHSYGVLHLPNMAFTVYDITGRGAANIAVRG